jgi:K+-transporting ATPase c subunit
LKVKVLHGAIVALLAFLIVSLILPEAAYYFTLTFFPYQAKGEPIYFNGQIVGYEYIYINISKRGFFNSTESYYLSPIITENEALEQALTLNASVGLPLTYLRSLIYNYSYRDALTGRSLVNTNFLNVGLLKFYEHNKKFYEYYVKGMQRIYYLNQTGFQ